MSQRYIPQRARQAHGRRWCKRASPAARAALPRFVDELQDPRRQHRRLRAGRHNIGRRENEPFVWAALIKPYINET